MQIDQAETVAKRVINTFRLTPSLVEWIEVLSPLELDECLITFRELRDSTETGGLTIGRFLGAYRGRVETRRRSLEPPRYCALCAGSGWCECSPARAHRATVCSGMPGERVGDGDCWCQAVEPCRCSMGVRAGNVAERIHDANRQLRHPSDPELLPIGDPRAAAALARGVARGVAERDRLIADRPPPPAIDLPSSPMSGQLDLDRTTTA